MKYIIKLFLPVLFYSFLFSCSSEADVFQGTWVDKKNPDNVWTIKKKGRKFVGTRVSGTDSFSFESETWEKGSEGKFKDPNKHILVLNPLNEKGTKVTYIKSKDMILRLPPGVSYVRQKENQ